MTIQKKEETLTLVVIVLLALNILLSIYVSFIKRDAFRLETLKVGGSENMQMAQQFYQSPTYIQQQKTTLEQVLSQMWTAGTPAAQAEVQPTVQPDTTTQQAATQ